MGNTSSNGGFAIVMLVFGWVDCRLDFRAEKIAQDELLWRFCWKELSVLPCFLHRKTEITMNNKQAWTMNEDVSPMNKTHFDFPWIVHVRLLESVPKTHHQQLRFLHQSITHPLPLFLPFLRSIHPWCHLPIKPSATKGPFAAIPTIKGSNFTFFIPFIPIIFKALTFPSPLRSICVFVSFSLGEH